MKCLMTIFNKKPEEYILCSAIHFDDRKVYKNQPESIITGFVVCGYRHSDCINTINNLNPDNHIFSPKKQGFLTNKNRFVSREEAMGIAKKAKQLKNKSYASRLFSENLY